MEKKLLRFKLNVAKTIQNQLPYHRIALTEVIGMVRVHSIRKYWALLPTYVQTSWVYSNRLNKKKYQKTASKNRIFDWMWFWSVRSDRVLRWISSKLPGCSCFILGIDSPLILVYKINYAFLLPCSTKIRYSDYMVFFQNWGNSIIICVSLGSSCFFFFL